MLGRTDRRLRLLAVLVALLVMGSATGFRLAYWQVAQRSWLDAMAMQQLQHQIVEPAQRGGIYDRTGTVLLATTVYRDQLVAYPAQIPVAQRGAEADQLAGVLGLTGAAASALTEKLAGGAQYTVLAPLLTPAQSDAVKAGLNNGSLVSLGLVPQPVRVYPNPGGAPDTTLASQLLGFVNAAGQGQYGVEQRYNTLLAGRPRTVMAEEDIAGRPIADTETVVDPGSPGSNLDLTVDAGLQLRLEKELYTAWIADKAASVSAVVMDAHTGAILAWGSVPAYDANAYQKLASTDPAIFVDPIVSDVYEPGSVMKMFVASAAFQDHVVTPTTLVDDTGVMQIGNNQIADYDRQDWGWIPFQKVISYSRNVGAARVAMMLGPTTAKASTVLYDTWQKYGIGLPTGVDVAGEVPGIVANPATQPWQPIDLANRAFGQGVAITLLQLARAYNAMSNGGYLVQPHVVASIDGQPADTAAPQRVITSSLSAELVQLMHHVVTSVPYYAQWTLIPGYLVGGKTGTAQIWDPKTNNWMNNIFDFSFVGYLGRQKPDYTIAVTITHSHPTVLAQGVLLQKITPNELFRRIAWDTIQTMDLAPLPGSSPAAPPTLAPAATPAASPAAVTPAGGSSPPGTAP